MNSALSSSSSELSQSALLAFAFDFTKAFSLVCSIKVPGHCLTQAWPKKRKLPRGLCTPSVPAVHSEECSSPGEKSRVSGRYPVPGDSCQLSMIWSFHGSCGTVSKPGTKELKNWKSGLPHPYLTSNFS